MRVEGISAVVTGGASGLGLATARALAGAGAQVTIVDLPGSPGAEVAAELGSSVGFAPADVVDEEAVAAAVARAESVGPLRALVHCAGRGGPQRVLDRDGAPTSLAAFESVVRTNLVGTFNVLQQVAAAMARTPVVDDDHGVCVLTASVAAYEGQIGQMPYAASKAGIVGMTLPAARDLAQRRIRVASIAPGLFDTALLAGLPENVRASLSESVPHPSRLGDPAEFAQLALAVIGNPMLNGETVRLDGAIRMGPR